jgi:hypothetical protein
MVLLIRVLIIGTFSIAGDRLFTTQNQRVYQNNPHPVQQQMYRPANQQQQASLRPASTLNRPVQTTMQAQGMNTYRPVAPAPKSTTMQQTSFARPEPTYHPYNGQNNDRSLDA